MIGMGTELVSLETLADQINEQQGRIDAARFSALERVKDAGELLMQAKNLVKHGEWEGWLGAHCRVSVSMARKYMQLAREWPRLMEANQEPVADLGIKDALKLLAKPRETKVGPVVIDVEAVEVVEPLVQDTSPEPQLPARLEIANPSPAGGVPTV